MKAKIAAKANDYQVAFIRRPRGLAQEKVQPLNDDGCYDTIMNTHTVEPHSRLAVPDDISYSPAFQYSKRIDTHEVKSNRATTPDPTEFSYGDQNKNNLVKTKESFGSLRRWYSNLTPKQKALFLSAIIIGIVLICATVAIVPPVLLLVVGRTSTTVTSSSSTSTVATPVISAAWTFDNTAADTYGIYNGALNGATYLLASTTQPYLAYGSALILTAASNQSFIVATPFLNMSYTSFTVEAWIYPTSSLTPDRGIFKQCACSTCSNQCLYMMIRSSKLYMGFLSHDVTGSTTLSTNTWYHVAFVYNYETKQQILYLNGVQDNINSNVSPYQGMNGSIEIGAAQFFLTKYFFNGYIDNLNLATRAKSSTEILQDASLMAYYSFDLPSPNDDNGPHGFNGSSSNTGITNGRVNQAMQFTGPSYSYFYAYGFYQFDYSMTSSKPFSISLWINPSSLTSSTFVQAARQISTTFCHNMLGIVATSSTSGQLVANVAWTTTIYGPFLTVGAWTHISMTYSYNNGITLYVNGILFGSAGASTSAASSAISTLVIGYHYICQCCQSITNSVFQGAIDEVYIHSRELTQTDVTALANP